MNRLPDKGPGAPKGDQGRPRAVSQPGHPTDLLHGQLFRTTRAMLGSMWCCGAVVQCECARRGSLRCEGVWRECGRQRKAAVGRFETRTTPHHTTPHHTAPHHTTPQHTKTHVARTPHRTQQHHTTQCTPIPNKTQPQTHSYKEQIKNNNKTKHTQLKGATTFLSYTISHA